MTSGMSLHEVDSEEAGLDLMEGRYQAAGQRLRAALSVSELFKSERLELRILECEIRFATCDDIKTSDIESLMTDSAWTESPLFEVQESLLLSRTKNSTSEALFLLESALARAMRASLLYEVCRLELEIASRLRETDAIAARPHAEEAIRIAKKNGYRPLLARAQLLRGLCSRHEKEMEHYIGLCHKLASEIGIPELISESAYRLGALYQDQKKYAAAKEHLANSTRITAEIAENSPARFRTKYLAVSWRKDARKRHEECLRDQPAGLIASEPEISPRSHFHFHALYKVSIAAASAQTVDSFLREILSVLGDSRDSTVVLLKTPEHTAWYTSGIPVDEELRKRVQSIADKARNQARFEVHERWIPFKGLQYVGGIYVRDRKRNMMGEDEMEFFSILASFLSSTLDQIHHRMAARPAPIETTNFHGIVGQSRLTRKLCSHIETIANNNATVLIQGETGTGKELVARAIHKLSARAKMPFIAVDCGAIPESLIDSELFGSKRGSFTGAVNDRPGVFEAAHGGTLFLDEISNMNPAMQAKLLRAIQEREIRRVGETRSRPVDVRLIAASNSDLKRLVAEGIFRQDLLFRLNVIEVSIPPLRARREDIPMLASHFLNQLNSTQKVTKVFGPEALHPLLAYSFPGNIRELQNCIERGFFTASGRTISTIPVEPRSGDVSSDDVRKWFADLAEGRRNFWTAIHDRYKQRDIPREKVVALVDLGLRTTRGSYKELASLFRIDPREYRRLMDFLRRNNCLLDFRPYRKVASIS